MKSFDPGFIIRIECDLQLTELAEWFFTSHLASGITRVSTTVGHAGLNYVELTRNVVLASDIRDSKNPFLYYPYSIEVYRNDPLPEEEELIKEQVALCRSIVDSFAESGWKHGIIGEVKQFITGE